MGPARHSTHRVALLLAPAVFFAACGGGGSAPEAGADLPSREPGALSDAAPEVGDAGRSDPAALDLRSSPVPAGDVRCSVEAAVGRESVGRACRGHDDCELGFCIAGPDGSVCTSTCIGASDCPCGWTCRIIDGLGGDPVSLCEPVEAVACRPCDAQAPCPHPYLCAGAGGTGGYCARPCDVAFGGCGEGWDCAPAPAGGAEDRHACVPAGGGACCGASSAGLLEPCIVTNAHGSCSGIRRCLGAPGWSPCAGVAPAAEVCDGFDNDCDGDTDEGLPPWCACGDGHCVASAGEDPWTCPPDCAVCGDGACSPTLDPADCPVDCCRGPDGSAGCGDGRCLGFACGENPDSCPADCGTACGDGTCARGESPASCAEDCKRQVCGNGQCEPGDGGPDLCATDCAAACGNCVCEGGEDFLACPIDCGWCGDGVCSLCPHRGEGTTTCPLDCGPGPTPPGDAGSVSDGGVLEDAADATPDAAPPADNAPALRDPGVPRDPGDTPDTTADAPSDSLGGDDATEITGTDAEDANTLPTREILWRLPLGGDARSVTPAVGPDGTIYTGSGSQKVVAVSPTGRQLWEYDTGWWAMSPPAVGTDGRVYVCSALQGLVALGASSGEHQWSFKVGERACCAAPAIALDGTLYAHFNDDSLRAISPAGTALWSAPLAGGFSGDRAAPVVGAGGTVYVGSMGGQLFALDPAVAGDARWSLDFVEPIQQAAALGRDGVIYVHGNDFVLRAIQPGGVIYWQKTLPVNASSEPVIAADDTLVHAARELFLLAPAGEEIAVRSDHYYRGTPAIGSNGHIYAPTSYGLVVGMTARGEPLWTVETGPASAVTIGPDGTLYVTNTTGELLAISGDAQGPAESPWPQSRRNASQTGAVPAVECGGGLCVHPPEDRCADDVTATVFARSGRCLAAECAYDERVRACAVRCVSGVCE